MRTTLMVEGQEGISWQQWLDLAEDAERLGFAALFTSDHYGSAFGLPGRAALDAWTVLAAIATRTRRIGLGTLVSPVTFRHPSVLARMALTVDQISGGRISVGLGAGWNEGEHAAFGFPFPALGVRMTMLEEQTAVVRGLLDGDAVTVAGAHYSLAGGTQHPATVQRRVPIILGGAAGPRAARLAAAHADEYDLVFVAPDEARAARRRLDAACEAVGRDPATLPMTLMTRCVVGTDEAEYRRRLASVSVISGEGPPAIGEEETWIAGTVDQALTRAAAFRDAGVTAVYLQHLDHADRDQLELVGTALVPVLEQM
jgi:alkanesulfonate monooxygenase SsuD/methylene tetrahydromethanopterin reductase-like flavin-dependent oxidoreductase (luciferase family)